MTCTLTLIVGLVACSKPEQANKATGSVASRPPHAGTPSVSALPSGSAAAKHGHPSLSVSPGKLVTIPAGNFAFGSLPGQAGRDPTVEPLERTVRLDSFQMDRLPFPNHPGVSPKTDVTRAEAQRLCKQIGKRLCTEAEWERACKGTDSDVFPTGHSWDQTCAASTRTCANSFGLLSLGTQVAEWTSSDLARPKGDKTLAIVRGGPASAPASTHRCAHRRGVPLDLHNETIGFRCCTGAPQSIEVAPILAKPLVQPVDLDAAKLQTIIDSIPRLSRLGKIRLFDPKQIDVVLSKGKAERGGNELTTSPLLWSPVAGEQVLVVAGIGSVGSAFVVALHVLPAHRYKLASSFVFQDQPGPVVLAHNGWTKRRIRWSSCWDCVGEEGAIIYRKGGRIVIEQR